MIKAIIFDFFGVVCSSGLKLLYDEYWHDKPEKLQQAKKLIREANLGHTDYDSATAGLAKLAGTDVNEIRESLNANKPNKNLLAYIKKELKPKYKIGILSNSAGDSANKYLAPDDISLFDSIVLSYQEGMAKPDKRIYELAAERLGVEPSECVFIDDNELQTHGAGAAGMKTICYQDFAQMKQELEGLLTNSDN